MLMILSLIYSDIDGTLDQNLKVQKNCVMITIISINSIKQYICTCTWWNVDVNMIYYSTPVCCGVTNQLRKPIVLH